MVLSHGGHTAACGLRHTPRATPGARTDPAPIGGITRIDGSGEVRINDRAMGVGAVMPSADHIHTVGDARAELELPRGGRVLFDADTGPIMEWISPVVCKLRILIDVGSILVETPCETVAETGSGAVVNTLGTTFHLKVTPPIDRTHRDQG